MEYSGRKGRSVAENRYKRFDTYDDWIQSQIKRGLARRRNKVDEKGFIVCQKFLNIKKINRLPFLIAQAKPGKKNIGKNQTVQMRDSFNRDKFRTLPFTDITECYVCGGNASVRHHVVPLCKGGRNKVNNIVPLCQTCHIKVHPHMQKGYKIDKEPVIGPVLCKPKQDIVVIPPLKSI